MIVNQFKQKAIDLRNLGYSYNMIKEQLGVSKSTLSNWLSRIKFVPNELVLKRVGQAKLKSALYKQKIKFADINLMKKEAFRDIGRLTNRDLFMLGIGLYIGEGSKALEEIRIVNSDPVIINLAIKWLKKCCKLRTYNLVLSVHCYPDNDINEVVNFWSIQTGIPKSQFGKTMIDTRKNKSKFKKRKLPYGTAHLYVKNNGTMIRGVKSLHRKIMGWIDASTKQV